MCVTSSRAKTRRRIMLAVPGREAIFRSTSDIRVLPNMKMHRKPREMYTPAQVQFA